MRFARRLSSIKPSATLALTERARQLKAAGRDVISLAAGEPDFAPPPHALTAMKEAVDGGATRYTAVPGLPELREAVAEPYRARGRDVTPDHVIIAAGAKQALYNAVQAWLDPGDAGVIIAPYWLSYPAMIQLAGGEVRVVDSRASEGFLPRPDAVAAALPGARLFIMNSPANPTGAVAHRDHVGALAEVLRAHPDVLVISDEIYERFRYEDTPFVSILDIAPDLADRTLVVGGVSKSHAMTGFRIGWATGPVELIRAMGRIQGQSTSNPAAPSQHAALAAIRGDQAHGDAMLQAFARRRRLTCDGLRSIPGVDLFEPLGAFYAMPGFERYAGRSLPTGQRIEDATVLSEYLVEHAGVVTVPGAPFGAPHHLRISFACSDDDLTRGLSRMREALTRIPVAGPE